jgi:hypothetical protein
VGVFELCHEDDEDVLYHCDCPAVGDDVPMRLFRDRCWRCGEYVPEAQYRAIKIMEKTGQITKAFPKE